MDEKTLTELLSERWSRLSAELSGSATPPTVAALTLRLLGDREWRSAQPPWKEDVLRGMEQLLEAQVDEASRASTPSAPAEATTPEPKISLYTAAASVIGSIAGAAIGAAVAGDTADKEGNGSAGAAVGATIGAALLGAAAHFIDKKLNNQGSSSSTAVAALPAAAATADELLNGVQAECQRIDGLVAQVRTIMDLATSEEAERHHDATLEKDYQLLVNSLQELVGYEATTANSVADYSEQIAARIQAVSGSLGNYGLQFVNYDGSNDALFECVKGTTSGPKMVWPALCKGGQAVVKGRLFV